jgi:hypothetical protein
MNINSLKSLATIGLLLAAFLGAGTAGAQVPVTDVAHIGINKFAWVEQQRQLVADELKQAEQIRNQVQQIETKLRDMQQQLVNGAKFEGTAGFRDTSLTTRPETAHVDEICGPLASGGLAGVLPQGMTGPARVSAARERQYVSCVQLVRTENRRFNIVVQVLDTIRRRDQQIANLRADSAAASGEERGRIARNNNSIAQLEAQHALDVESAHRTLQAYDALIATLKGEIGMAGQSAFSNRRNSLYGQIVQYGTLKVALEGARRVRER